MKQALTQILTSLVGLFRATSGTAKVNHQPASPPPGPEADGIRLCHSLRHGGNPVRRVLKARGTSAHGLNFEVFQCPTCGRFAAVTLDPATGREAILFSGKYYRADYNPRRQGQQRAPFRPVPVGHAAS